MPSRSAVIALVFVSVPVFAQQPVDPDHAAKMAKGLEIFKRHIRPVLTNQCVRCHGGMKSEAGLDLNDRATLLKGGESGPAVRAGHAKDSLLVKALRHEKAIKMPKEGAKLSDSVVQQFVAWIDLGAPYDQPLLAPANAAEWIHRTVDPRAKQHWAFQPLHRVEPPVVRDEVWSRSAIDRFLRFKQQTAGIEPNPPLDRRRLIRRAYFDLIGLPPTPTEIEQFVNDPAPLAYERLLDRLLASPQYGVRWARHWLDLVRFAESHGFEHDYDRPTAYHYRDFVIEALNRDLPYDRFVKWQLAGDEYAPTDALAWKATGFLAAGVHSTQITKNEVERHRYDELDDILATTGTAFLGLTVGCARCHDHKYDPIPQADYYRLLATFTTTVRSELNVDVDPNWYASAQAAFEREHEPLVEALRRFEKIELPQRLVNWERGAGAARPAAPWWMPAKIQKALATTAGQRSAEQQQIALEWYKPRDAVWRQLHQRVQDHRRRAPQPKLVKMLVASEGVPAVRLHTQGEDFLPVTHFLRRGDTEQKDAVAAPGFLQVLLPQPNAAARWQRPPPAGAKTSFRRTALAEWLTDGEHGAGALLARVAVNRLWQQHFGRGIVATPSDFGTRGEPPTHPELLDWLAAELIARGWSLKQMHKVMMTSAAYLQDSRPDPRRLQIDRDNQLLWRRPGRRLEAEVIRDALLAVSGMLDQQLYGPGTLANSSRRRAIYFTIKRSNLVPMMSVFDAPEALAGVAERPRTTIAPQALLLMNNPEVRSWAHAFGRRVTADEPTNSVRQVARAFQLALGRAPTAAETEDATSFLRSQADAYDKAGRPQPRELALADFCQTLFCVNEFVFVD